jgi:hypothetical protein
MDAVPVPPRDLRPEIPPGLDALVRELLAKNPDDRPRDATEVRRRLDGLVLWEAPGTGEVPIPTPLGNSIVAPLLEPIVMPPPEEAVRRRMAGSLPRDFSSALAFFSSLPPCASTSSDLTGIRNLARAPIRSDLACI